MANHSIKRPRRNSKPDGQKSRVFTFRLNPSEEQAVKNREHETIETIDFYLSRDWELRDVVNMVVLEHRDRGIPREKGELPQSPEMQELAELKLLVKWIASQIESGALVQQRTDVETKPTKKGKKAAVSAFPEHVKSGILRYMNMGDDDE